MQYDADFLVIGGGFYGCCLALFLRSAGARVVLVEAGERLLDRASRVNQARIHTGYHYPRSALTAVKSLVLHQRFAEDFPAAVVDDFEMLYAIARNHSKVSAGRFHRMFAQMGAPIAPASPGQAALFDADRIEAAFRCREFAFDASALRVGLEGRLGECGVDVRLGVAVIGLEERADAIVATLGDGRALVVGRAFNVTYAQVNHLLGKAGLPPAALKHELAEVVLVEPPAALAGLGVTVMDGPFFSCMPYPARGAYSLTHVRYTPHASWTDATAPASAYEMLAAASKKSRAPYMIRDAARYMPALGDVRVVDTLFEVKTVLQKNERDDGRPILYQQSPAGSRLISILGGKLDNVYDLFEIARREIPELVEADERVIRSVEAKVLVGAFR